MDQNKIRLETVGTTSTQTLEDQKNITEDMIRKDPAYAQAYRTVQSFLRPNTTSEYAPDTTATKTPEEMSNGIQEFTPEYTDEEAAEMGMQMVSDFKNAFYTADQGLGLIGTYNTLKDAPEDVKKSAWYMWKHYDRADATLDSATRFFKSMGVDPTMYTPALSLKLFGQASARKATEMIFKKLLLGSGVAGGAYTGGEEALAQELEGEYDPMAVATATSIGAVVGTVIPAGIVGGSRGLAKLAREGEEEMQRLAGGGIPPVDPISDKFNLIKQDLQDKINKIENSDSKDLFQKYLDSALENVDDVDKNKYYKALDKQVSKALPQITDNAMKARLSNSEISWTKSKNMEPKQ